MAEVVGFLSLETTHKNCFEGSCPRVLIQPVKLEFCFLPFSYCLSNAPVYIHSCFPAFFYISLRFFESKFDKKR